MSTEVRTTNVFATAPYHASPKAPPRRLDGLQLGRAIAACGVAVAHAVTHYYGGGFGIWGLMGQYGVILFFVISGFIMVVTTGPDSFSPAAFMSRRIRRIVPIYYTANLALAAGTLVVPGAFERTAFDVSYLLKSLLFLPTHDPSGSGLIVPFFKLGWTLNYEMFFYVLFASLFALSALQRGLAIAAILACLIVLGSTVQFESAMLDFYTRIATAGFAFGTLLGLVMLYRPHAILQLGLPAIMLATGLCLAMLAWVLRDFDAIKHWPSTTLLLSLAATLNVLILVAVIDGREMALPAPLLYLGDASYSIYLFHMFAVGVMTAIAHRLPEILVYPALALSGLAAILAGVVAYWLIESRFNRFFRNRRPLTAAQIASTRAREVAE